jgi:hypothetical protein
MKPVKTCQKWSKMKRNLYSFISPSYFELTPWTIFPRGRKNEIQLAVDI